MSGALWRVNCVELRARDGKTRRLSELNIEKGEKVALVGADHEFRRSIIRCISGLEAPRSGKVLIEDHQIIERAARDPWRDLLPTHLRRKMGVSLLRDTLLSNVSIGESFETLFRFKYGDHNEGLREGAKKIPVKIAKQLGLSESCLSKRPDDLDALQKRLASLCLAFLTKPSILLLDDPTFSLDDKSWEHLEQTLHSMMKGSQKTFILSTSDWVLADSLCERFVVLEEGKMIFDGNKETYKKRLKKHLVSYLNTERQKRLNATIERLESVA